MTSPATRAEAQVKAIVMVFVAPSSWLVPLMDDAVNADPTAIFTGTVSTTATPLVPAMTASMVGVTDATAVPLFVMLKLTVVLPDTGWFAVSASTPPSFVHSAAATTPLDENFALSVPVNVSAFVSASLAMVRPRTVTVSPLARSTVDWNTRVIVLEAPTDWDAPPAPEISLAENSGAMMPRFVTVATAVRGTWPTTDANVASTVGATEACALALFVPVIDTLNAVPAPISAFNVRASEPVGPNHSPVATDTSTDLKYVD